MPKTASLRSLLVAVLLVAVGAFVACGGKSAEEKIRDLSWEVLEPNVGQAVAEPGSYWTFGLRSPDNRETFDLTIKVTDPSGITRQVTQTLTGDVRATVVYPGDFAGASTREPGVYAAVFEVEGIQVARDSFEIFEPPPPEPIITQPLLTGAEAAGIAERWFREGASERGYDFTGARFLCEPEDYNDVSNSWIVHCALIYQRTGETIITARLAVDGATGEVAEVLY